MLAAFQGLAVEEDFTVFAKVKNCKIVYGYKRYAAEHHNSKLFTQGSDKPIAMSVLDLPGRKHPSSSDHPGLYSFGLDRKSSVSGDVELVWVPYLGSTEDLQSCASGHESSIELGKGINEVVQEGRRSRGLKFCKWPFIIVWEAPDWMPRACTYFTEASNIVAFGTRVQDGGATFNVVNAATWVAKVTVAELKAGVKAIVDDRAPYEGEKRKVKRPLPSQLSMLSSVKVKTEWDEVKRISGLVLQPGSVCSLFSGGSRGRIMKKLVKEYEIPPNFWPSGRIPLSIAPKEFKPRVESRTNPVGPQANAPSAAGLVERATLSRARRQAAGLSASFELQPYKLPTS
ncbi:hypothetical protein Rhopal_001942-T1 [Rhodotorula paludigena]|uniref:Uncharacterized protein n=1 Tax=Rhodotorula paludigena TaxID=86838 RepID=A0AAV5G8R2_9BASI|nr:hypothetical protein Rhopal_001942-T1 [Rhodotorula paludigena]